MKKKLVTKKYKIYLQKRSRKNSLRRRKFASYLRYKNLQKIGKKQIEIKYSNKLKSLEFDFDNIEAPKIFSFVRNPNQVISFINDVKVNFDKRRKTLINLKYVKEIDYDTILLLFSIMIRFKSLKIDFNGSFPKGKKPKDKLIQSGFFEHLYSKSFSDTTRYSLKSTNKHDIYTHAFKKVDSELGSAIISKATETIWGTRKRCQGAQRTLLELMQNTNNHASLDKEGDKHWWLSVSHDEDRKTVYFSFVDYGVGVFTSLANKKKGSKFYNSLALLVERFRFKNEAELFKLVLNGELHRTVTGEHFRGKGLPGVKEAMDRNQISNLVIITNNVFSDIFNNDYRMLEHKFVGTFISWELNCNNKYCNGNY